MNNHTPSNKIIFACGLLAVTLAVFGIFILPRLIDKEDGKITVSEAFKTEEQLANKENDNPSFSTEVLTKEGMPVVIEGYVPIKSSRDKAVGEIKITDPENYPKGISREGNEDLFIDDKDHDELYPPELEYPDINLSEEDADNTNKLYAFLHPINIYYQTQLNGGATFFENISEAEFTMVMLDEHRHTIPFFNEYLGYDKDIYLCYAGRDAMVYSKYDYERGDLFYYTTSEEEMNAYCNGELSNEDVMGLWGLISMKYSEMGDTMYFLRYKSPLNEDSSDDSLNNQWVEY